MKKFIIAIVAALSLSAFAYAPDVAPEDDWMRITETDEAAYFIKKDSGTITTNKRDEKVTVVTGRITVLKTERTQDFLWYVRHKDCIAGRGTLVFAKLDGTFLTEIKFKFNDDYIASDLAEVMCYNVRVNKGLEP